MDDDELEKLRRRLDILNMDVRSRRYWGPEHDRTAFPTPESIDDRPSPSRNDFDSLQSELDKIIQSDEIHRSRAATRLQSRYRGNRIRTLKKRNRETLDRMRHNVEQMKRSSRNMDRSPVRVTTRPLPGTARSVPIRYNPSVLDLPFGMVKHGLISHMDCPTRLRWCQTNRETSVNCNTEPMLSTYIQPCRILNKIRQLIEVYIHKNHTLPERGERSRYAAVVHHMDFDNFIIKYLELPLDVKQIVIDSSISMNLDKSALELYDSSDEEEYDNDEETNNFYNYLQELQIPNKLYRLTQLIVDNLIESGNSELQAYRYTCYFVEFLIDNYY